MVLCGARRGAHPLAQMTVTWTVDAALEELQASCALARLRIIRQR